MLRFLGSAGFKGILDETIYTSAQVASTALQTFESHALLSVLVKLSLKTRTRAAERGKGASEMTLAASAGTGWKLQTELV